MGTTDRGGFCCLPNPPGHLDIGCWLYLLTHWPEVPRLGSLGHFQGGEGNMLLTTCSKKIIRESANF